MLSVPAHIRRRDAKCACLSLVGCVHDPLSIIAMDSGIASGTYRYYVSLDFGTHGSGFAYSAKVDGDSSPRTYE